MKKEIIPFVDHEIGYRLLNLMFEYSRNDLCEIPFVITTEENGNRWWKGVEELCKENTVPLYLWNDSNREVALHASADWFLLLSWKHLLDKKLLAIPRLGTLNLHYSLLPKYRGINPVNWAIINGDLNSGFSYHLVTNEIDAGPVIFQYEIPILAQDTARSLQLRLDDAVVNTFPELFQLILEETVSNLMSKIQISNDKKEIEYNSRHKYESILEIDLCENGSFGKFLNLLRGVSFLESNPQAYFFDKRSGKKVYVHLELKSD